MKLTSTGERLLTILGSVRLWLWSSRGNRLRHHDRLIISPPNAARMLAVYPDSYPDELLYSVFARLSNRLAFPRAQHLLAELFGTPDAMIGVDLPSYLHYFIGVIPHGHGYTTDQFIEQHTLLPFYEPFLDQSRAATIRARMKAGGRQGFQFLLGPKGQNLKKPDRLRYCPQCVRGDREQYGECYWHRVHQVPGVIVCPHHGVWLETSEAPARDLRACHAFRPAEQEGQGCAAVRGWLRGRAGCPRRRGTRSARPRGTGGRSATASRSSDGSPDRTHDPPRGSVRTSRGGCPADRTAGRAVGTGGA